MFGLTNNMTNFCPFTVTLLSATVQVDDQHQPE